MALSNIGKEPRRELTESLVGLAVFGAAVWADYTFAQWLQEYAGWCIHNSPADNHANIPWPLGMAIGSFIACAATFILFITHGLGDVICNAFQRQGIHLRPRNRPTQR